MRTTVQNISLTSYSTEVWEIEEFCLSYRYGPLKSFTLMRYFVKLYPNQSEVISHDLKIFLACFWIIKVWAESVHCQNNCLGFQNRRRPQIAAPRQLAFDRLIWGINQSQRLAQIDSLGSGNLLFIIQYYLGFLNLREIRWQCYLSQCPQTSLPTGEGSNTFLLLLLSFFRHQKIRHSFPVLGEDPTILHSISVEVWQHTHTQSLIGWYIWM